MLAEAELRARAKASGSVNVDLATVYELRWHDPEWLAAWERYQIAVNDWDRTWPGVDMRAFTGDGDVYHPNLDLVDEPAKAVAVEYLTALAEYQQLTKRFLEA